VGVRLQSVRVVPTDASWTPAFNSQNERVAHRVFDLSELVVFWSDDGGSGELPRETHLVEPVSAKARLRRVNGVADAALAREPRMGLELDVGNIAVRATNAHLEHLVATQSHFAKCRKAAREHSAQYERWRWLRPRERPSAARGDTVADWWRYAAVAASHRARHGHTQRMSFCWTAVARRRAARHLYISLWTQHATIPVPPPAVAVALAELERKLSIVDVRQFRMLADERIATDPGLAALRRAVMDARASVASKQRSWTEWAGTYFAIVPQRPADAPSSSGAAAAAAGEKFTNHCC
jgi:hypothetical protein